jgi:molecular chaperone DnaK
MVESRFGRTRCGKTFPSYVLFDTEGNPQRVGQRAKEELVVNPRLVIWGVKRLAGLTLKEARNRGELTRFQYDMTEAPDGSIMIAAGNKLRTPADIIETILREMRADAENSSVNEVIAARFRRAVIGVPAFFTAVRAGHITEAARRAGFDEVDTIAEPTAAALRYSLVLPRQDAKLLVFDMGAGTLDVTLVQTKYVDERLLVGELAVSGDECLGGVDMDDLLTAHLVERYSLQDIERDVKKKAILKEEIEKLKIRLSSSAHAPLDRPPQTTVQFSRDELQDVLRPVLDRCRGPIHAVLNQAGVRAADVAHVLFVGGPTYMPCVRRVVRNTLEELGAGRPLLEQIDAIDVGGHPVNPMECVAQGTALMAAGLLEPLIKVLKEGYGTAFPTKSGRQYYMPIIKHNGFYPADGRLMITYRDPHAKVVYFDLMAKREDRASPSGFTYELLGWQPFFIQPTGRLPWIDVRLEITDRKELVTELVHFQTDQRVKYTGLNLLQGESVELQEEEEPEQHDIPEGEFKVAEWTRAELERIIQVANAALETVPQGAAPDLQGPVSKLRDVVDKAVGNGLNDPNADCPRIADRIIELVHALFLLKVIQQAERDKHLRDLAKIAGGPAPA